MPVCITGMGRSGTSMVTRVLYECGLYLGPESRLLPENPSNRDGHWENACIVELNDTILTSLGGRWNEPPSVQTGWEYREDLDPLAARAERIVKSLESFGRPWGWKDPRTALTMPFWRRLVEGLRVVICVRQPAEVARSLAARDGTPPPTTLDLWLTYNRALLDSVPAQDRIVTRYDSFLQNPYREIERLVEYLGLRPTQIQIARAAEVVTTSLRNHEAADPSPEDPAYRNPVLACYEELAAASALPPTRDPGRKIASTPDLKSQLAAAKGLLCETRERLYALQDEIEAQTRMRVELEKTLEMLTGVREEVGQLRRDLDEREGEIQTLRANLDALHRSRSFRFTAPLRWLAGLWRRMR